MSSWTSLSVDAAIDRLNEMLKTDPDAMASLIKARVPCNQGMADHPTFQVSVESQGKGFKIGVLGVLNGLFGADDDGWGPIAALYDREDSPVPVSFVRTDAVKRER